MLPLTLVLLPLAVLAAPSTPEQQVEIRSLPIKPNKATWNPSSKSEVEYLPYGIATDVQTDNAHTAKCDDCMNLQADIRDHNGIWQLDHASSASNVDDWTLLKINGTCTLLVRNNKPTKIGNGDASFHMSYEDWAICQDKDQIESKAWYEDDKGSRIYFWIRNTGGLDLSQVVGH